MGRYLNHSKGCCYGNCGNPFLTSRSFLLHISEQTAALFHIRPTSSHSEVVLCLGPKWRYEAGARRTKKKNLLFSVQLKKALLKSSVHQNLNNPSLELWKKKPSWVRKKRPSFTSSCSSTGKTPIMHVMLEVKPWNLFMLLFTEAGNNFTMRLTPKLQHVSRSLPTPCAVASPSSWVCLDQRKAQPWMCDKKRCATPHYPTQASLQRDTHFVKVFVKKKKKTLFTRFPG